MKQDTSNSGESPFIPPVSAFTGPIAELVGHRLLSPPTRPGLLASLARFEVLRILGGGGMGVVVLARDAEKGQDVAIKLIKPELVSDQRVVHRFVKEAGHLQKLKHPNVVPVLEVSDRPEGPYFVMPYFERGSLAARIRPGEPLDTETILQIARQVAEGLNFAHKRGIIHRDLKPANILLAAEGKACLADFGLARTMFNDTIIDVEHDQMEGTAPYLSPGVAAGNAEDTRCDIYAFGALLYEMLTGEPPYAGRNTKDIRAQILAGPPKSIKTRNPDTDSGIVTIAEGAMARELRDRYADMADVVADLERVAAGKSPVGARSPSRKPSLWIPAGILMIGVGLYLLWSGNTEKKAATPSPATNAVPQPVVSPSIVTPPPPVVVKPVPTVVSSSEWKVTLLAGQSGAGGSADGVGGQARFQSPGGIAVDAAGNVYVADTGNNMIRKIAPDGTVTTLAGAAGKAGRQDSVGAAARFLAPMGIAVDSSGNVYVAEFASDIIRKISPDGEVHTLAGSAGNPGSADGIGDNAYFRNPWSLAVDAIGNVFVADKNNFTIREITPAGQVSTFAGFARLSGATDGPGSYARFNDPQGVAVDAARNVYVADTDNYTIRKISPAGIVSTLAGMADQPGSMDGRGNQARFFNIQGMAATPEGWLYVLDGDLIRHVSPDGKVTTPPNSILMVGNSQTFHPTSIAAGQAGALYFADGMNNVIWQAVPPK
jgi:serine/threonine protein kinase/sugar lactone lactonase YvrE